MHAFSKTYGGLLLDTNNNEIEGGGIIKNEEDTTIIPLGLIFIKSASNNKPYKHEEIITELFDDNDWNKLYKKVKPNKKIKNK